MRTPEEQASSTAIIKLMQGVIYRETNEDVWRTLERNGAPVLDHFARIGVRVIIDEVEGYAYLKTSAPEEGEDPLPRLVQRRELSYNASLLLLLLRKRLAEFEAGGEEGKLVLERDAITEMLRLFLPDSTDEVRIVKRVDASITQVVKLGFLEELRGAHQPSWEVKRIIKAYVDAETMADFASTLAAYAAVEVGDE